MIEPGKGFNLSRWAIAHGNLTRFLILLSIVAGITAYLQLGQKEDPDFTFRLMVVRTYWPGATAAEMVEQVTDKLEAKLQETPHLDKIQSYAKPGETATLVFVRDDTPIPDIKPTWYQVRKKIYDMQGTLPKGVIGPFFNDEFGDTYIAMMSLSAEGFNYQELKSYAEQARSMLLTVPGVEKIDLLGEQEEKIYVDFSYIKFSQLGISFNDLKAAVEAQNAMIPAGALNTDEQLLYVRHSGHYETVEQVANTRFRVGDKSIRLGDFAKVYRGYQDPPRSKIRHEGKEVLALGIVMRNEANVLHVGEGLDAALKALHLALPVGIEVRQFTNQPKVVHHAVGEFLRSLSEAVVIGFCAL